MATRIKSNSQSLKQRFPEVYEEFFSRCFLVVSCPVNFWIVGEYINLFGAAPAVKQNLPLRIYCGLNRISSQRGTKINREMKAYLPSKQEFIHDTLSNVIFSRVEQDLYDLIQEKYGTRLEGLEVSFLSEAPRYHGINTSGTISASLAAAILLHLGIITPEQMASWSKYNLGDENFDQNAFHQTFGLARYIYYIVQEGIVAGSGAFAPLLGSYQPVIYTLYPKSELLQRDDFFKNNYGGFKLGEMGSATLAPRDWAISYTLINSGDRPVSLAMFQGGESWIQRNAQEVFDFYKKNRNLSTFREFANNVRPLRSRRKGEPWLDLVNFMSLICLDTIKLLITMFEEGIQRDTLKKFFQNISFYNAFHSYVVPQSSTTEKLTSYFTHGQDDFSCAAKVTGGGGGGDIILYSLRRSFKEISGLLYAYNQETGEDGFIDYNSDEDGFDIQGAVVEQDLTHGIRSTVVPKGSIMATTWENGVKDTLLLKTESQSKFLKSSDLTIDQLNHDIFIRGKKLTSKEVKSAKATAEILSLLLTRDNHSVFNYDLPQSSYAADRNELQSKIISPLNKVLKRRLRQSLDLKISGGISKFTISLGVSPTLRILLLQRQI